MIVVFNGNSTVLFLYGSQGSCFGVLFGVILGDFVIFRFYLRENCKIEGFFKGKYVFYVNLSHFLVLFLSEVLNALKVYQNGWGTGEMLDYMVDFQSVILQKFDVVEVYRVYDLKY